MALTDNLISYWKLDEASGDALDSHGSNDLTESSGTIASATGIIGNCRDFELGDTEWFDLPSNSDVSMGDIDFTISCWVNLESLAAVYTFVGKDTGAAPNREYLVEYTNSASRFRFGVFDAATGASFNSVNANNLGAPSASVWYFIVCWHDSVSNTINIQVNNGTPNSQAHTTGVRAGAAAFRFGARGDGTSIMNDGLLDEVGLWKRILTSDERTALYNGLTYPFTASTNRRRRLLTKAA